MCKKLHVEIQESGTNWRHIKIVLILFQSLRAISLIMSRIFILSTSYISRRGNE